MKKLLKRFVSFLLALPLVYIIWNHELVIYGVRQLNGQMHIISNAQPIDEVLHDTTLNDKYRNKLILIEFIRKYAVDSLGLKESKNYTTFYDQKDQPVLWVLTACDPLKFKPYEWHFPLLGNVPYKGFFREDLGKAAEAELRKQVLDVNLSTTGGWSTLGWFKDPVLSNMLKRSEGQLAELIIHELTHATIYIPDNVDYNENLATFIGEQGAIKFLSSNYGPDSKELKAYLNFLEDEKIYGDYMLHSTDSLEKLYQSFKEEPFREKMRLKYLKILQIVQGINHLKLNYPERYIYKFPRNRLPDNTWFMSFRRYRGEQKKLEQEFEKFHGNFRLYIESLVKK